MPEEEHQISTQKNDDEVVNKDVSMNVKVYAPFKIYFDGEAQSISAVNGTGPFDILPRHHNFMTLLNPCNLLIRHGANQEKISINRGIMHVKADRVTVFLDI